jgi:lysophospholipase L1-like esterase
MGYEKTVVENLYGIADVWAPEENCQDSAFIIRNLDKWFLGRRPDLIYMNCGLHDMFIGENGKCRRTVDEYAQNIQYILRWFHEHYPQVILILASTTPVMENWQITSKTYGRLVRRNQDIHLFNSKLQAVASDQHVPFDDLNDIVMKMSVSDMLIEDGIHLNAIAEKQIGKYVADRIQKELNANMVV